ncbi:MAG: sigma-70 family RNA polymerase sigma factor [Planctomycetota bacterium]|nr:sigma-70 family RNA polymerase sigma factor [Planctomycetota bacterium]
MIETNADLPEVVSAACSGSQDAEAQLYRRYYRFVERRMADARRRRNWFWLTDLDDAVQDVFIQFFQALKSGRFEFKSEDELKGFLIKTSFFVVMNLKDKKPRERSFSQFSDEDGENPIVNLAVFSDNIFSSTERKKCLKLFYAAIDELTKSRRDVIVRTLLGEKVRDICAATNKSPASVSGLKFNALKELRSHLEKRHFLEHCGEVMEILGGNGP